MNRILLYLIIAIVFITAGCTNNSSKQKISNIICDMESRDTSNQFFQSNYPNILFKAGKLQSSEEKRNGNFSIRLDSIYRYGLDVKIKNVKTNEYYKVSVWRKSKSTQSFIVTTLNDTKTFYRAHKESITTDKNGWQLIELDFVIPERINKDTINIYLWNADTAEVFFDDFKIQRFDKKVYPEFPEIKPLRIYIDSLEMIKLYEKIRIAFQNGILETQDDDWVNAIIFYDNEMMKSKVRLKGDWLDHLQDDKWSFRIKLSKEFSWLGMRVFSIQNPETRFFIYEWIAHKICEEEDLLTPRYGFVPVYLNDNSLGIYAYEEHFVKQLIESKKRREGPIIKFNENMFWQTVKFNKKYKRSIKVPDFFAAEILPQKINYTLQNPAQYNAFLNGQNLLFQHKMLSADFETIFKIDKIAAYFAITDLVGGYHGLAYINKKFYYDPIIGKLEPIAYDNYTNKGVYAKPKRAIYPNFDMHNFNHADINGLLNLQFFQNQEFRDIHLQYLRKLSNPKYIKSVYNKYKDQIKYYEKILQKEFINYKYDTTFLFTNAQAIADEIPEYEKIVNDNNNFVFPMDSLRKVRSIFDTVKDAVITPLLVKSYLDIVTENESTISIDNFNLIPIKIIGTGSQNRIIEHYFEPNIIVGAFTNDSISSIKVNVDPFAKHIFFTLEDNSYLYNIPIFPWQKPTFFSPQKELIDKYSYTKNDSIPLLKNNIIVFKSRKYHFNQPIIIPKNYSVVFKAGCHINFTDSAFFISYSPVYMNGLNKKPIIIESSDNTAAGFTVLQAHKKSKLKDVIFKNLNTLNYKRWTLTGAVSFYESDVDIIYSSFENNFSEDALNIIRSNFNVRFCSFDRIFSDAFDSDFCTGNVYSTFFTNINNDAIDFSGSTIFIENCEIDSVGDKGISGGENSNLTVVNTNISNSKIGIASKDLSLISLTNVSISNCEFGIVAFRKKPEFGAAKITSKLTTIINSNREYLIEKKSEFIYNSDTIIGQEENVARLFYFKEEN